ncbi:MULTISPECIES: diacylglycerol kinase family protein [Bacillaceae]|uniref:diacylglycerol kinase family protein n=1 Tax=Bacillaceae TaxID=186817 RepID=UPI002FFFF199
MSMDLNGKHKSKSIVHSFSYAITGIITAVKQERNMRFHLVSAIIVLFLSIYFSITKMEWLFVLFAIGGMLVLEMLNSAIERVVDLSTTEIHPLAKQAKDMAAGAVFLFAILSIVVGLFIFLPYIF